MVYQRQSRYRLITDCKLDHSVHTRKLTISTDTES